MRGDFSRRTFDPAKHYSAVLMQQGRMQIDADWNEQQAIHQHRLDTTAVDMIGGSGAPQHQAGFAITVVGGTLHISAGRYYVDGWLCENDTDVAYDAQPHLPTPPTIPAFLAEHQATRGLVYLDVWQRHLTALDDPLLREKALGGPDTTTRLQTVWQVKILPLHDATATCASPVPAWTALLTPRTGLLNARTQPPSSVDSPCLIPPSAGYQRLENQLYRVEIHQGGEVRSSGASTATYKWSRDNGVVLAAIQDITDRALTVSTVGPDTVLGFAPEQWVELSDDRIDLSGQPGPLLQIESVDPSTRRVTLKTAPPIYPAPNGLDLARHAQLRRWDQTATTASPTGLPITPEWLLLEDGIEVQFAPGTYASGDYWLIPARTATGDIEWPPYAEHNTAPLPQPPLGIQHHYCRLAIIESDATGLHVQADCRTFFPPLSEVLTKTQTIPALHVVETNWGNDETFLLSTLLKDGLQITLDAAPVPEAVTAASMIVTLDNSWADVRTETQTLLRGNIAVRDRVITWSLPYFDGPGAIDGLPLSATDSEALRLRITLKGAVIWGEDAGQRRHLDGQAFGRAGRRGDGTTPRTALVFPTGAGARASDFESWCLVTRALRITTIGFLYLSGPQRVDRVIVTSDVYGNRSAIDAAGRPVSLSPLYLDAYTNTLDVTFSRPVLPRGFGPSGTPQSIRLVPASPGAASLTGTTTFPSVQTVRFTLDGAFPQVPFATSYRLLVLGHDAPDGPAVRAQGDGTMLDGDFTGEAGGDFGLDFSIFPVIG